MKRIRLDFALMASAALMTASCVNNNEMRLSVPEEITLTGELMRPPVTRTQLDIEPTEDGSLGIMWSPGDKIGVFGKSTKNAEFHGTFTTAVASGLFSGKMTGDNPEFAYYPFVKGATDSKAIPVTVAKVQTYTDATSIAANDVKASDTPVKKADGSHSFVFKPMVSILKNRSDFRLQACRHRKHGEAAVHNLQAKEHGHQCRSFVDGRFHNEPRQSGFGSYSG